MLQSFRAPTLNYASPLRHSRARLVSALAAIVSLGAAAFINYSSLQLAHSLIECTSCGTGRAEKGDMLLVGMPLVMVVPFSAWLVCRRAGFYAMVTLCGLCASATGWLVCAAFIAR